MSICIESRKKQRTIKNKVSLSGIGLFTGKVMTLHLCPSNENAGICIQRIDLPFKPIIPVAVEYVKDTTRRTTLGKGNVEIQAVEHLLSALHALEIDNIIIEVSGPEIPICDGSALSYIQLLQKAGIQEQMANKNVLEILQPIFLSDDQTHLVALPAQQFQITYTLHYPHSAYIRSQHFSYKQDSEKFIKEIAPSRTFALYEEIQYLLQKNMIPGGGLNNAVIIQDDKVMNSEGVRFADEMVRHKILDLMGDLTLVGMGLRCHIIAIHTGHSSNVAFAKLLKQTISSRIC